MADKIYDRVKYGKRHSVEQNNHVEPAQTYTEPEKSIFFPLFFTFVIWFFSTSFFETFFDAGDITGNSAIVLVVLSLVPLLFIIKSYMIKILVVFFMLMTTALFSNETIYNEKYDMQKIEASHGRGEIYKWYIKPTIEKYNENVINEKESKKYEEIRDTIDNILSEYTWDGALISLSTTSELTLRERWIKVYDSMS